MKTINFSAYPVHLEMREVNAGVLGKPFTSHFSSIEEARMFALVQLGIDCRFARRFDVGSPVYRGSDDKREVVIYW